MRVSLRFWVGLAIAAVVPLLVITCWLVSDARSPEPRVDVREEGLPTMRTTPADALERLRRRVDLDVDVPDTAILSSDLRLVYVDSVLPSRAGVQATRVTLGYVTSEDAPAQFSIEVSQSAVPFGTTTGDLPKLDIGVPGVEVRRHDAPARREQYFLATRSQMHYLVVARGDLPSLDAFAALLRSLVE